MLVPLRDLIYVLPIEDPDKIGSIHVPDMAKQRTDQGIVAYVGPQVRELKEFDHVLFSGYTGTKISVKDLGVVYVMKEKDVLATIPKEEESEQIFSETQVKKLIESAHDDFLRRDADSVDTYVDILRSKLDSYTSERGFEF